MFQFQFSVAMASPREQINQTAQENWWKKIQSAVLPDAEDVYILTFKFKNENHLKVGYTKDADSRRWYIKDPDTKEDILYEILTLLPKARVTLAGKHGDFLRKSTAHLDNVLKSILTRDCGDAVDTVEIDGNISVETFKGEPSVGMAAVAEAMKFCSRVGTGYHDQF